MVSMWNIIVSVVSIPIMLLYTRYMIKTTSENMLNKILNYAESREIQNIAYNIGKQLGQGLTESQGESMGGWMGLVQMFLKQNPQQKTYKGDRGSSSMSEFK